MGAFGFALAGGLQGLGEGLVQEAKRRREEAMQRLKMAQRQAERKEDRQWRKEDRAEDRAWREEDRAESREWAVEDRDLSRADRAADRAQRAAERAADREQRARERKEDREWWRETYGIKRKDQLSDQERAAEQRAKERSDEKDWWRETYGIKREDELSDREKAAEAAAKKAEADRKATVEDREDTQQHDKEKLRLKDELDRAAEKRKGAKLTSSMQSRIDRDPRVKDFRGDPDPILVAEIADQIRKVMNQDGVNEDEAWSRVSRAMRFSQEKTTGGGYFGLADLTGLSPTKTETILNNDGKGDFVGFDMDGDGKIDGPPEALPRGLGVGAPAAEPAPSRRRERPQQPGPQSSGTDIPSPKTKAEYDALPPGTRYRHPDGNVRVKP